MEKYKEMLLKILEAIEYNDNKEEFTNGFIKNIYLQTILDLVETLGQDRQDKINSQLNNLSEPEDTSKVLKEYFSQEEINKSIEDAAKTALEEYIKAITPILSANHKKNLIDFAQTLK